MARLLGDGLNRQTCPLSSILAVDIRISPSSHLIVQCDQRIGGDRVGLWICVGEILW